jgi:uncharacterized membrane protein
MLKLLYSILVGLVGAALLHLIIILSIPHYSDQDAYSLALVMNAKNRFQLVENEGPMANMTNGDPFMRHAICTYDVSEQPLRLTGFGVVPFWSVAVFDDASNEVFSMNERTSVRGQLDVVVANAAQLATIRKIQPAQLVQSINVEVTRNQGYVVLRSLMPQPSFEMEAERFLRASSCQVLPLPQD